MKRSGDVTAAAIILLFGSGVLVLFMLLGILAATLGQFPPEARYGQLFAFAFYALFAAWGIVTGIGIIQLRSWARISILVMSALAIFCCVGGSIGLTVVPMIFRQTPDVPPAFGTIRVIVGIFILLIPLAVAIWWLVLFTRRRVIAEFANGSAAVSASVPLESSEGTQAIAVGPPSAAQIPLSIRIITVFFLIGVGMALLSLTYSIRLKMPALLLGKIVEGWPAWVLLIVLALVQLVASIAVFKKRAWALDVLIACAIFGLANSASLLIAPARARFFQEITQRESLPPNVSADLMKNIFAIVFPISIGLGAVLGLIMLYFLSTRRRAFRAACAPPNSNSNSSASATPDPEIAP